MGILISALAGLIGGIADSIFRFFVRYGAFNIALLTLTITALGVALNLLLDFATSKLAEVASGLSAMTWVPFLLPSNFNTCVSAYFGVATACTIYRFTINYIDRKAAILKA